MRRRVLSLSFGALAAAAGCATSTSVQGSSPLESLSPSPAPRHAATPLETFDSLYAQSVADHQGPRVSIRAEVSQLTSSRRVRAVFNVEDDAYVVVGHVDASGVLRIVFPSDPHDDGFVQGGGRRYETAEFFGGFNDAYNFRYANYGRFYGPQPQSYDGSAGYLFIVASWRPMHVEKFSSNGDWDSFEVTSEAYIRDPRPAIYEFASVLAGQNREEYTVAFASYFNSQDVSPFATAFSGYSAFGLGMCSNSFFGFAQPIPWSYLSTAAPFLTVGGDQTFYYRGREYYYDSFQQCATALPYSYAGISLASNPFVPGRPTTQPTGRARVLSAFDNPRKPFDPRPPARHIAPIGASDAGPGSQGHSAQISTEYRRRGLVTEDRPEGTPASGIGRRFDAGDRPTRPSIEQMTQRRTQNHDDQGFNRGRVGADDAQRSGGDRSQAIDRARTRAGDGPTRATPSEPSRYVPRNGGGDQGARSAPPPRMEAPRTETRSAPPPRSAEPRSSEPASRATPPASSSSSSSGSKPPGR